MAKINYNLLPVKAHYFFFLAAMGPVLPFIPVMGKHLGVSEVVVGGINGIIPLVFLGLKPFFGYLIDYFQEKRKVIFITLLFLMGLFFFLIGFIPDGKELILKELNSTMLKKCDGTIVNPILVQLSCGNQTTNGLKGEDLYCSHLEMHNVTTCQASYLRPKPNFYASYSFWAFVVLMSLGTIGYNISNSVSDAVCFSVLGDGCELLYGKQRVWGTIGFGITALLGGYFMSLVDGGVFSTIKDFFPAFLLCGLCVIADLACCLKLKLPPLPKAESIVNEIWCLMKQPHILTFLIFAVFVGICDSSFIFYLLWYLEDLAKESTGEVNMKLLQGLTVASETLVGEVVSFYLSGKILGKLGYGFCLSLCFFFYFIRLGLIAIIPSPWWIIPIELLMQGPTYALCYTTIVAYASAIAPPGTSATVQGIVAGMDDGFGFFVGNLVLSFVYKYYGGRVMFASVAFLALICSIVHTILYILFFRKKVESQITKPPTQEIVADKEASVPLKNCPT